MSRTSWVVALLFATTAASAADVAIDPGLYEIITKTNSGGAPTTERKCLTRADIDRGLQPSVDKTCKVTRNTTAAGKLDFAATCPDMSTTMSGSYTTSSYQIDGRVVIKSDDDPMTIESHITARKVGACKG